MKKLIRGRNVSGVWKPCIIVILILLLCSSAWASTAWDGRVGTLPEPVGNVYTITTPGQLAAVARVMERMTTLLASMSGSDSVTSEEFFKLNSQYEQFRGKTFVLANDIDLNNCEWTPIGTMMFPFLGTFDGQGHSVAGLKISRVDVNENPSFNMFALGLFGAVSGGDVKNVAVSGEIGVNIVDPSVSYVHIGGVAADVTDGDVIACVSNIKITFGSYEDATYADFAVGGVSASVTKDDGTIFKCINNGDITCTSEYEFISTGGVVANTNCNMDSCENVGNINIVQTNHEEVQGYGGSVGGIVASAVDNTVSRCINRGIIEFDLSYSYVGGVAGYFGNSMLIGCENYGDITENSDSPAYKGNNVGGIAGTSSFWDKGAGNWVDWNDINVINACVNEGNITVNAGQTVGGITSSLNGRLDGSVIKNCMNRGNVSNLYVGDWSQVGGIAGYSSEPIINCVNLGDVYGNHYVAGIVGYIWGTEISVSNCTAICDVVASKDSQYNWVGGIVGTTFSSENALVENSVYCGQLVGVIRGAIVGEGVYYSEDSLTISDCAWVMTAGNDMDAYGKNPDSFEEDITTVINSAQVDKLEDAPNVSVYVKGYTQMFSVGDENTFEAVVYPNGNGAIGYQWTSADDNIFSIADSGNKAVSSQAISTGNTSFTLHFGESGMEQTAFQFPITVSDWDNGAIIEPEPTPDPDPIPEPTPDQPSTSGDGGSGGGCNAGFGSFALLAMAAFVPIAGMKFRKK